MKAADAIDQVIKAKLAATLKADRFKKSARTFHRSRGTRGVFIDVVNVQASQWNAGDSGRFTLNLGVYLPELDRVLERTVHDKPKEYHCHARARIGALMPTRTDHWWEVSRETDLDALAEEIDARVRELVPPWFDALSTPHALETATAFLGDDLARAALALLDGRREDARARIAPHRDASAVRRFAERYDLGD